MKQKFMSYDGRYVYTRESRWIQVRYKYVTSRHSLYDYARDNEDCLAYFIKDGKQYAMGQFMRFNYPFKADSYDNGFIDKKGVMHILSGYDATDYWKPYLLEVSENGEQVRLYTREVI